jgi:hypothetical protein
MKRVHRFACLFLVPTLAVLLGLAGCKDTGKEKDKDADKDKGGQRDADKGTPAGELEALTGKGVGTLKGKVTYDGDPPERKELPGVSTNENKDHCLKGDVKDQTWMVGPDKGVMNVVVWLRAPKGKYFNIPADQQKSTETRTIEQPFCAFQPHVIVFYPSYFDGKDKKQEPTGQQLKVINNAPIGHNTAWRGDNSLVNVGKNEKINPKGEMPIPAKPCASKKTGEDLLSFNCDLHKWMTAFAWVFDHPYAAVTKADGTYEIKNVPTGVEVELVHWHESFGHQGKAQKITLKDGDNTQDFKVKK